MLGLTSFLDDSVSQGESPITTIGGPAMSRISFKALAREWWPLLKKYRISPPLHMTDFVRPHGKYVTLYAEMKQSFFRDVVKIINRHKLYSISISIPQAQFGELMPEVSKEIISPYALAFCCAVLMNQGIGKNTEHMTRLAYLIDKGCAHRDHLENIHTLVQNLEKERGEFRYTGAIAFDQDNNIPGLQAADVVAWSARRREVYGQLTDEFAPLEEVLLADHKPPHAHVPIPRDGIAMWAKPITNWLTAKGRVPTLSEFIR